MAKRVENVFHDGIEFSLRKLGNPNLELKKEQYDAIRAICLEKSDVLTVLPTGFGKSLCYQVLPGIFDYMRSDGEQKDSIVIVVSPLNALIRDQLQKLKDCVNVCVLQSSVDEGEQKVTIPKDVNKCSLLFGHPEVFVDNKTVAKMLKGKEFQSRVRAVVIDEAHLVLQWCSFRPAYGKIGVLSNLFPAVPIMALTGTATRATKSAIIDSLGLSDPVIVEFNPDRANLYYASHVRPDRGDEKLESILRPIVVELKEKKNRMPLTLIYGNLETIADCFLYFSNSMGKDQYYPSTAQPLAKNRLFTQYHAEYPEHERNRIVEELVKGTCTHRILFVTIAFGLGIDCNNIRQVIHIGVPYTMEDYCQEVGRAGRDGLPARADIFYNSYDISKSKKNMSDIMRNFVKSKQCKRKMILSYFGHDVPKNLEPAHMCCDFHSHQCTCDDCELAQAVADLEVNALQEQPNAVHIPQDKSGGELKEVTLSTFDAEVKTKVKTDLIEYRVKLQRELGRSTVGGVGLSSGFSIGLIDLALQNLTQLTSVEKVETVLPVYSHEIAKDIFSIIQKHTSGNIEQ